MVVLSPEARTIALKIQCPICEGESIAESHATIAKQMRAIVQEKVDAGWNEKQIIGYFQERYGTVVLREPPRRGLTLGVWLAPPLVILAGLSLIVTLVWRWRKRPPAKAFSGPPLPAAADEEVVARELERLRRSEI